MRRIQVGQELGLGVQYAHSSRSLLLLSPSSSSCFLRHLSGSLSRSSLSCVQVLHVACVPCRKSKIQFQLTKSRIRYLTLTAIRFTVVHGHFHFYFYFYLFEFHTISIRNNFDFDLGPSGTVNFEYVRYEKFVLLPFMVAERGYRQTL